MFIKRGRGLCLSCHEVRAGNNPVHIRNEVVFRPSNWEFNQRTKTGGKCGPACHKPMEYIRNPGDPRGAADTYAKIAKDAKNVNAEAQALRAQMRCLAKAGDKQKAIQIATTVLNKPKYRDAADAHGRLIVPSAQLFALQLMESSKHLDYRETLKLLVRRLTDYSDAEMGASQRRFLMQQLREISAEVSLPTLAAEILAAEYLDSDTSTPEDSHLRGTRREGTWQLASPDKKVIGLFRNDRIISEMRSLIDSRVSLTGASITVVPPGRRDADRPPFLSVPASPHLPDWQLALHLEGPDPFAAAAGKRITAYLWAALLVIAVIVVLALVSRQMKLTRLKNDLIATVSHELKTPLASMRVLVDTLLEGHYRNTQQAEEYLHLVARENVRLSRLIDNFLTFSRMERNKRSFEFTEVRADEIVAAAVDAVGERFQPPGCRFDVETADDLPTITADRDAMVTVLLNLLDNAYKYSENDKHVVLRTCNADGDVCFEVEDNGIGLSRRALKKIFGRFYQVDQSLSRNVGGCGLGLSIVKFIVEAHGGSVEARSQPGQGSTFAVRLPPNEADLR